jgi:hypothetical protein
MWQTPDSPREEQLAIQMISGIARGESEPPVLYVADLHQSL